MWGFNSDSYNQARGVEIIAHARRCWAVHNTVGGASGVPRLTLFTVYLLIYRTAKNNYFGNCPGIIGIYFYSTREMSGIIRTVMRMRFAAAWELSKDLPMHSIVVNTGNKLNRCLSTISSLHASQPVFLSLKYQFYSFASKVCGFLIAQLHQQNDLQKRIQLVGPERDEL